MNIVTTGLQEPDRLAPSTHEAIRLAQEEAVRMQARAVYPEHLLLGVIAQGENKAAKMMCRCGMDMPAIRVRATEIFGSQYTGTESSDLPLSKESLVCIEWAISVVSHVDAALVLPEHLVLGVLRHPRMLYFLTPFSSSVELIQGYLAKEYWEALLQYIKDPPALASAKLTAREGEVLRLLTAGLTSAQIAEKLVVSRHTVNIHVRSIYSKLGPALARVEEHQGVVNLSSDRCPACKKEALPGWKHCAYCGASLTRICPNCGTAQPEVEDAQYCFECGNPLENEMQPDFKPVVEEMNAPERGVRFSKGQQVRVLDGPFTEYIGTVVDIDTERSKVTVLVSFFGRETPVVLDFLQVEKI